MEHLVGKKLSEISLGEITADLRVANVDKEEGIVRFTTQAKEIHVDWDNGSWTRYKEGDCGDIVVVETADYSGKPLSQMPYDKITIGMELISAIDTPGKVVDKYTRKHRNGEQWLIIDWDSGRSSQDLHECFNKVKVK